MTISIIESTSVEALAFNYLRFGLFAVVNNLWTLVAVVTAAVSFWRFKLAPTLARQHARFITQDAEKPIVPTPPVVENVAPIEFTATATTPCHGGGYGGVARGKVYSRFFYEAVDQSDETAAADEEEELDLMTRTHDDDQRFNDSERLRKWDLGLYDFQDLSVLNGNVVRLWDSCRVSLSPRANVRAATITTVSGGEMWFREVR